MSVLSQNTPIIDGLRIRRGSSEEEHETRSPVSSCSETDQRPERMRDWLIRMINSGRFTGLEWLDEDKTVFKVPWIHAKKRGYNRERDAALFREWAMHSGRYKEDSDPTAWKINFRCDINGLKDIMEIKDMQTEDCRVYKVLPSRSKWQRPKMARQRAEPYPTSYATEMHHHMMIQHHNPYTTSPESSLYTPPFTPSLGSEDLIETKKNPSIPNSTPTFTSPTDDTKVVDIISDLVDHPPTPPMSATPPLSLLHIRIFYGSIPVHTEYLDCKIGCRIISKESSPSFQQDELMVRSFGPPEAKNIVLPDDHPQSCARDIFNAMRRGVLIEASDGNVYVTPLCRTVVYCANSPTDMAQPLKKEVRSKVFDYRNYFRPALEQYALVHAQLPTPCFILGLGQSWGRGRHVTQNLISIAVTHAQARQEIDAIGLIHAVTRDHFIYLPDSVVIDQPEAFDMEAETFLNGHGINLGEDLGVSNSSSVTTSSCTVPTTVPTTDSSLGDCPPIPNPPRQDGTRLQDDRSVYPLSSPIHSSAEGQKEVTIHNLETATSPNAHSQSLLVESVDNRQGISDHKGETGLTVLHNQSIHFREAETRAQVPFLFHHVLKCDCNGQQYTIKDHDITLRIPKGAVAEGEIVHFEIGVAAYGPFHFPENTQPISPIVWLCLLEGDHELKKPFQLTVPHVLTQISKERIHYHKASFVKANHSEHIFFKNAMNYKFNNCDVKPFFTSIDKQSYGVLVSKHFCFYCLKANKTAELAVDAGYSLVRVETSLTPQRNEVNFCAIYLLKTCLKSLEEQCPREEGYRITSCRDFKFNADSEVPYIEVMVPSEHDFCNIAMEPMAAKIRAADMDFWSMGVDNMQLRHDLKMYPPRVKMTVGIKSLADLTFKLAIKFNGCSDDSQLDTELTFPLGLPASMSSTSSSSSTLNADSQSHTIKCGPPQLKDVFRQLLSISKDWKNIGTLLSIPSGTLDRLEKDEPDTHSRLRAMLTEWLKINHQPTWIELIDAVEPFDPSKAEELKKHHKDFPI